MAEESQMPNAADDCDIEVLLERFSDDPILDFDLGLDLDLDLLRESWVSESDLSSNVFQSSDSSSNVQFASVEHPPMESGSPDSVSSFVNYIESFLMDDVDWDHEGDGIGGDGVAEFLTDVLIDESISSESNDALNQGNKRKEKEEEDEDFSSKKRRRQMRNRESAMISRERKKMYIKNLEVKNKNMEMECRRLDYALRCCMAENMTLRQSLEFRKNGFCGVAVAKQESAVLYMESLLLGSLFWLASLVCLFLPLPSLQSPSPNLKILCWPGRELTMADTRTKSRTSLMLGKDLKLILLWLRRRCRSMRARMKFCLFPLHAILT